MQQMQGPRDWMPPLQSPEPPRTHAWAQFPKTRPRRGLGLLSFFLGAGAAAIAIAQPATTSAYSGYVFSTIGISAVVFGVVALRRNGRSSLLPVLGILLGAFGTLFMVSLVVQFYGNSAASHISQPFVVAPPAPSVAQASVVPPVTEAPAALDERMQLAQAAGTVSFLLTKNFENSGSYPTALRASSAGMVVTPVGSVQLPNDARLLYVPAISGSGYSLTITGPSGAVAKYDTATGVVTND